MIQFYDVPFSPFAQKVKIALLEKGLDYETPPAELGPDTALSEVNPRGEVPALVDDGLAIFDSSIILEYLEDRYPEHPLRPADAAGRARVRMIEEVCDGPFEAVNWGLNEMIGFKRASGDLADHILARKFASSRPGWRASSAAATGSTATRLAMATSRSGPTCRPRRYSSGARPRAPRWRHGTRGWARARASSGPSRR